MAFSSLQPPRFLTAYCWIGRGKGAYFIDEETEAWLGKTACPESHRAKNRAQVSKSPGQHSGLNIKK